MPLESATVIPQLDPDNPLGTDPISNGDNHVRLIKEVLVNQLGSLGAELLTVTAGQINTAAASAGQYATGTSTTSLLIGIGTKTFTTQTARGFGVGQRIKLTSQANIANYMLGTCSAYDTATGAMSVAVDTIGGAGTFADWSVIIVIPDALLDLPRQARTANTMLVAADTSNLIDVTSGTFTQTVDTGANLGANWFVYLINSGTGVVTYDGVAMTQGAVLLIQSDGTTVRKYAYRMPGQIFIARDEKTSASNGGAFVSATWNARALNTVQLNTISGASLNSGTGEITLPAGTYVASGRAPVGNASGHKARLYNVTGAAVLIVGSSSTTLASGMADSCINGSFVLASTSAVRIEHYIVTAANGNDGGRPSATGASEVYAEIKLEKVA